MDEATMIARANEEREKLYQRYDRGRESGAEIDPWEDPAFEVYHQTDRYGFIHDKRLPKKTDPNETKARQIEMERVNKWLKMTKKWNDKKTREVLHKRTYKGIPDKLRSIVWLKLLNIEKTMNDNKNVYQKMLKLAREWSTEARQIDSDVNRQFREHINYRERYSIKQRSLFNVLTAYSMYNMEVGYCQGMSGVAGVLLMYMDEEEAFWALSTLLSDKKYAMHGLYIEGFPKLTRFLGHHDKIIAKFLPKLKKHFDQYNLDSILYSLKWFFVIFIERIPFSLCLRVWDIYLLDGERVVTAMAYTILRLHKTKLLKLKDMDLIVQYLQTRLHKDFGYDDDFVIKMLQQSMDELKRSKLDLPPPPTADEFPKRPFGVFTEPNFEAKVGIRKSIFTDTEIEVTNKVILRREITAHEIAETLLNNNETNSPLNTEELRNDTSEYLRQQLAKEFSVYNLEFWNVLSSHLLAANIPESEDGGSLLGSSRKSLADTSVTSTADLSVFSGGQRSQLTYDVETRSVLSEVDDVEGDAEDESSPGSAFCSLSIVGRTPSAMMITPIPRAMSPQDIVRIYVPPAPPEEHFQNSTTSLHKQFLNNNNNNNNNSNSNYGKNNIHKKHNNISSSRTSLRSLDRSSGIIGDSIDSSGGGVGGASGFGVDSGGGTLSNSNRNSIVSEENIPFINRRLSLSMNRSDEDLLGQPISLNNNGGTIINSGIAGGSTMSTTSRRGSLGRKSPLHSNLIECSHMLAKRRSTESLTKVKLNISLDDITKMELPILPPNKNNSSIISATGTMTINDDHQQSDEKQKIITSFEKLANDKRDDTVNNVRMTKSEIYRDNHEYVDQVNDDEDDDYDDDDDDDDDDEDTEEDRPYSYYKQIGDKNASNKYKNKRKINKYVSESNIQYQTYNKNSKLPSHSNSGGNFGDNHYEYIELNQSINNNHHKSRKPINNNISTENLMNSFEYENFKDEDDDIEENYCGVDSVSVSIVGGRKRIGSAGSIHLISNSNTDDRNKSSDDSLSSPNKSQLATPINESIPLLFTPITNKQTSQTFHNFNDATNYYTPPSSSTTQRRSPPVGATTPTNTSINNYSYIVDDSVNEMFTDNKVGDGRGAARGISGGIGNGVGNTNVNFNNSNRSDNRNIYYKSSRIPLYNQKVNSPVIIGNSSSNNTSNKHEVISPNVHQINTMNNIYNNSNYDFDSRIAVPIGGAYEFNNINNSRIRNNYNQATTSTTNKTTNASFGVGGGGGGGVGVGVGDSGGVIVTSLASTSTNNKPNNNNSELNKIRIKINQRHKN